jgi:CHAD domain-containing protein
VSGSLLLSGNPGGDVRAVLEQLAGDALRNIEALPDRAEERIHDIRVDMKKFRAVVRLAEGALKARNLEGLDQCARAVKDGFGAARDREVQLDLLRKLLGQRKADDAARAFAGSDGEPVQDWTSSQKACGQLSALVARADPGNLTRGQVLEAWLASYRAARRTMMACLKNDQDDFLFHEWRKRVKQLLYQSQVIGPPADSIAAAAQKLSSTLGLQHDLAMLCENVHLFGREAELLAVEKKHKTARLALRQGESLLRWKPRELLRTLDLHE